MDVLKVNLENNTWSENGTTFTKFYLLVNGKYVKENGEYVTFNNWEEGIKHKQKLLTIK